MLMETSSPHWHFPRPELAQAYLASFELGLSSARGLFARRRMGKTEFLIQDFIPAAEAKGYACVYVNLWDLKDDPATALVSALYKAIEPKSFAKAWERLRTPLKKIKASGKVTGFMEAGIEAELGDKGRLAGTLLMDVMAAFDKTKITVILIIDEAQVLANAENAVFAHALRAALDIRKERIKVLFAGSSEATLRRMFGRSSEPFYNWAALEPFQLLGKEFVTAMVSKVAGIARTPLSLADALAAFDELKQTPLFFRLYLDRYLTNPFEGARGALDFTKAHVFNDMGFEKQWNDLLPADQILLTMIAEGASDLQGAEARSRIGESLGLDKPVAAATPQNALRRLVDRNIVTRMDRGSYQFEDEAFADWVRHRG
ncbi:MAG: hypothetical protein JWR25_1376 [Noviherbaspirillum sp.]|jgi:hypothetical protein|nr:hypothetical protein [Noviherbaspirillum sp.]